MTLRAIPAPPNQHRNGSNMNEPRQQLFSLKWNNHMSHLVNTMDSLYASESLTDCVVYCEGASFKGHKVVLASCRLEKKQKDFSMSRLKIAIHIPTSLI